MIDVRLFRTETAWTGFCLDGHADYGGEHDDIICASVSALTLNAANSIEAIARDEVISEEDDGHLDCRFPKGLSHDGAVLMESMILGLRMISEITDDNGEPFLKVTIEEV